MARAVKQHKAKPAKQKSRRSGSRSNPSNSKFDERLNDAFLRLCGPLGGSNEAVQRLTDLACQWVLMPVMVRYAKSGKKEILSDEDWQNRISLSVGLDATGADCLDIHDHRYFHPAESEYDGPAEYWVRSADIDRELARAADAGREERPDQTIAAQPPPGAAPNRTLRRRETKHPWFELCAEIARGCIDLKTQRVAVPTNDSKLAEAVLQWCVDNNKPQPAESEMREATRIICAALRKI